MLTVDTPITLLSEYPIRDIKGYVDDIFLHFIKPNDFKLVLHVWQPISIKLIYNKNINIHIKCMVIKIYNALTHLRHGLSLQMLVIIRQTHMFQSNSIWKKTIKSNVSFSKIIIESNRKSITLETNLRIETYIFTCS